MTTLFRIIKYPTITEAERAKRNKAMSKALKTGSEYYPDSITNCERCDLDFTDNFRYGDSDRAVVCNACAWSRKDRLY